MNHGRPEYAVDHRHGKWIVEGFCPLIEHPQTRTEEVCECQDEGTARLICGLLNREAEREA